MELIRFARRESGLTTTIVFAWVNRRRTFFDDGGIDTDE